MKLIAFGASNSKNSINQQFAHFAATQFDTAVHEILNLNHYDLPLYGIDLELESGIPQKAIDFYDKLNAADLIIISLAEHNGSYTAVFKNLFDWLSRYQKVTFEHKKMFLLSTSPGGRGGQNVMDAALLRFPLHGATILSHFCLPFFQTNFNAEKGIIDEDLNKKFQEALSSVKSQC